MDVFWVNILDVLKTLSWGVQVIALWVVPNYKWYCYYLRNPSFFHCYITGRGWLWYVHVGPYLLLCTQSRHILWCCERQVSQLPCDNLFMITLFGSWKRLQLVDVGLICEIPSSTRMLRLLYFTVWIWLVRINYHWTIVTITSHDHLWICNNISIVVLGMFE